MKNLLIMLKCAFYGHNWTCNAKEGIKPTKEQIEANGLHGFREYSRMYCKRCGEISRLTL